jgi:hypothetical protein
LQFANYLFFVASERAGQLVPEFVWVKMSKSATDNEALRFVDQADLFGDGQEEIVAVITNYENYRCLIYGRTKGGANWKKISETEVRGACERLQNLMVQRFPFSTDERFIHCNPL